jgi:GNAT superfamily N-acetyltransferase
VTVDISLVEITDATRDAAVGLRLAPGQERFVSTVEESLDEAARHPEGRPWPRLVLVDGVPSAFVMLSWECMPDPPHLHGPWFLWKLLVDSRAQGRGVGRAVVAEVVSLVRDNGGTELLTSHVPGEDGPAGFYARLGFTPTGETDADGEILLRLPVT